MAPGDSQAPVRIEPGMHNLSLFELFDVLRTLDQDAGMEVDESEAQSSLPASRTSEIVRRDGGAATVRLARARGQAVRDQVVFRETGPTVGASRRPEQIRTARAGRQRRASGADSEKDCCAVEHDLSSVGEHQVLVAPRTELDAFNDIGARVAGGARRMSEQIWEDRRRNYCSQGYGSEGRIR